MNWLRTILDSIIICITFNGVAAFVWLLRAKYTDRLIVPGTEDNEM